MTGSLRLLSIALFAAVLAAALAVPAPAQSPTPVTSILNGGSDTTLEVTYSGGLLMPGKLSDITNYTAPNDSIPATGAGTRLMWYPEKAAFRAGAIDGTQWDASNIGDNSIALGRNTKATDNDATAMGYQTTAGANGATAMGNETTASGQGATAMGNETTASGFAATAMGQATIAATSRSLSTGFCNGANTSSDDTFFAVGNGSFDFNTFTCSSRSDALVLKKNGDLAVGHSSPDSRLHARDNVSGSASDPSAHVGFIENTGGTNADGLAIQSGPNNTPGSAVNYLTFYDGDGDPIGAIEGDGGGGITRVSGSGDFAEELPVREGAEVPEPAEIVGVENGELRLETSGADRVMIASRAPILTGNATPATSADDDKRVAVAFIGQVPAKVRGTAQVGDLIVASGRDDGTARAVAPAEYRRAEHGPIAGQAWSAKNTSSVGEVTVAVGLGRSGAVAERFEEQRQENQRQEDQIANLKAENEALETQQLEIKKRLAALEAERSPSVVAGWAGSGTGLLLAFLLGGLVGAGLLWRRRG